MDWSRVAAQWEQMRKVVKERWGELTDEELDHIAGQRDLLVTRIRHQYGMTEDEADRQVRDWEQEMK
ncbi:MAG: CsbD family protein [Zoogloea sp.]|nr:CsbD family protein [Zoogloea sp.]